MIDVTDAVPSAAVPLENTSPVWQRVWHPVAAADEVTGEAPAQVLVAGEAWVLARLDGRLVAFEDRCAHQGSPLSAGDITRATDGTARLTCAYHGWRFDATGRCDLVPVPEGRGKWGWEKWRAQRAGKRSALRAAYGVTEAYGLIWLAPREPLAPLPAFPEWNAPGMTRTSATAVTTNVSAGQLIDSFLDAAHFPRAHAPSAARGEITAEVTTNGWQVTGVFAASELTAEPAVAARPLLTKTAGASGTAHARLELPHATIGILLGCQPEDWMTTRVFTLIAWGGTDTGSIADAGPLDLLNAGPVRPGPVGPGTVRHGMLSTAWRRLMTRAAAAVTAH